MFARVNRSGNSVSQTQTYSSVNNNVLKTPAHLRSFDQAPSYLQTNPYLHTGYRVYLTKADCIKSMFCWTNETINIWSHLVGFWFFVGLLIYDINVTIPKYQPSYGDITVMMMLVLCCMTCMACSTAYHIFCCHSEGAYFAFLKCDITGIIFAFAAIFISGIHYAYACFPVWRAFYQSFIVILTVLVLRSLMKSNDRSFKVDKQRMVVFTLWALFGFVPSLHWAYLEGGFVNPVISSLLPRVGVMYVILGVAFFFYLSRYPERCCPGKVDYLGSSHQVWHVLIVAALFWWHQTGIMYADFKNIYGCSNGNSDWFT